ncbi:hypothetical protein TVAG_427270 [Trichomonas vaginalis G3]|uniref:Uncharacterized protein n=1 Tax=Trichomonas vaginalis (strain ATCC PRA-98 / G3) TaxID=412133 RepID=A2FNA9_TRIV3|nr:microtubule-associated protein family [Trichomonas vaginalis G3]EAX93605.1 hypothetical protein TVAG_427270 [Trichomonas vaginalis G3]KAI5546398.1 microtubule-associated protein family [Trichomonas vaginalis G3]|eukprot:XP_001306535.1 hypothetical protein [Trichomonas vaginalis G3]
MTDNFSDLFNDSDQQLASDVEHPKPTAESIQKLEEQIEILQKENLSLRSQFEGTLAITNQIDSINNELLQAKSQSRKLTSENDDLQHRLDLTIKAKAELLEQLEEEKKKNTQVRSENYFTAKQDFDRQKAVFQQKLEEANDQIVELNSKLDSYNVNQKVMDGKIDKIVQNAQRFFNEEFESFDSLCDFLSQPQYQNTKPVPQIIPNQHPKEIFAVQKQEPSINNLKMKLKNAKGMVHDLSANNQKLQDQINQLTAEIQSLKQNNQRTISSYESKITEQEQLIKEKETIIVKKTNQINELKAQLSKPQKQVKENPVQQKPQKQVVFANPNVESKIEAIKNYFANEKAGLLSANGELKIQLASAQDKNNDLANQLKDAKNELAKVKSDLNKQNNEIETLKVLKDNHIREIDSLRNALHARIPQQVEQPKPKAKNNKDEIKKLQETISNLNNEIVSLQVENNNNTDIIQQLKSELSDAKTHSAEVEEKMKQIMMDLNDANAKLAKKPVPNINDLLPPETWYTNEFGSEVAEGIHNISKNLSLQPGSKIRAIYNLIKDSMCGKITELTNVNADLTNQISDMESLFGEFLIDMSISLQDKAFTFEDFMKSGGNSLINQIRVLRTEYDSMKHMFDSMQSTLVAITTFLQLPENTSADQIINIIGQLTSQLQERTEMLIDAKKKLKVLKSAYQEASEKSQQNQEEILQENEALKEEMSRTEEEKKQISQHLTQIKVEFDKKDVELTKALTTIQELQENIQEAVDKIANETKAEIEQKSNELQMHLDKATAEIEDNKQKFAEYEQRAKEFQSTINSLKAENAKLSDQLKNQNEEFENRERENMKKFEEEKREAKQQFDAAIQHLNNQMAKQLEDITKMAADNTAIEQKMSTMKAAAKKVYADKKKAEDEAKFSQEQYERKRRLLEAQSRAKVIAAENFFNTKLEEEKMRHESETRKIYTFVAEAFKSFFNPSASFNERNFKAVIEQVSDELVRLTKSDENIRRMLGASEKQTTEDAVAILLLH